MSKITNDTFAKHMRLFKQRLNENKIKHLTSDDAVNIQSSLAWWLNDYWHVDIKGIIWLAKKILAHNKLDGEIRSALEMWLKVVNLENTLDNPQSEVFHHKIENRYEELYEV